MKKMETVQIAAYFCDVCGDRLEAPYHVSGDFHWCYKNTTNNDCFEGIHEKIAHALEQEQPE